MNVGDYVGWPYPEVPGTWIGGSITSIEGDVVHVASGSMYGVQEYIQSLAYLRSIKNDKRSV